MDEKIVMEIYNHKISPFKKDGFFNDNNLILSYLQSIAKELKAKKRNKILSLIKIRIILTLNSYKYHEKYFISFSCVFFRK